MIDSKDTVRRVNLENAEAEGFITLKDAAVVAGVTPLTANKRLVAVGLAGAGVAPVALGVREGAGRPSRLFPRAEALEAVLNGVGNRRANAEKDGPQIGVVDAAPMADETNALLAELADGGVLDPVARATAAVIA